MGVIAHVACHSVTDTERLASTIAAVVQPGDIVGLAGNLGAGKTAFARSFIRTLTESTDEVPSPTFTLVQTYDTTKGTIWHCDLYRLAKPDDALELGLEEAFDDSICLIEWPERLGTHLPARRLLVSFAFDAAAANHRCLTFDGNAHWIERLKNFVP